MMNHQIKCRHCNEWTNAKRKNCSHCNEQLAPDEESSKNRLKDPLKPQLIEINEEDGMLLVLGKRIIQTGQVILYAIVSFIIWLSSVTVG